MVLHAGSPGSRTNHMMVVAKGVKIVLKRLLCGPRAGLPFVLGKKTRFLLRSNSGRKKENTHTTNTYDLFLCVCVYVFIYFYLY